MLMPASSACLPERASINTNKGFDSTAEGNGNEPWYCCRDWSEQ